MSPVRIPANSVTVINGTGPTLPRLYDAIVERLQTSGHLPATFIVVNTFVTVRSGHLSLRVANIGHDDIWLSPKTRVAVLMKGDVENTDNGHVKFVRSGTVEEFLFMKMYIVLRLLLLRNQIFKNYEIPVDISHLSITSEQTNQIRTLFYNYNDVFSKDDNDVGYTTTIKHRIRTIDDKPVVQPYRRIPPSQYEEVKNHIKRLIENNIIRESTSPYASPIVLVRKKDHSLRLCVDYWLLNSKTYRDSYPLPRVEESFDVLKGSKIFSTMDLTSGYNQLAVHENDIEKTAFTTPMGLYEYLRMPFGLCNAPATFQRLMQHCFRDEIFNVLLVFLDDIIVYSTNLQEHLYRLETVFKRLRDHGLKLKPSKCHFFKREVRYLGHIVSSKGIQTDPDKISAVRDFDVPTTVKNIKSFLGLAGYYRRFIKGFSQICAPLHKLSQQFTASPRKLFGNKWNSECQVAFDSLKEHLISAPILNYAKYGEPFVLETDASMQGLGAVLSQHDDDGKLRVIAYASRSLRPNERNMKNYSSRKLELLALTWAITEKFRDYLLGSKFTVYTDNNPLCYLHTSKLSAHEQRWLSKLADFDFDVKYRQAKHNSNADALSRMYDKIELSKSEDVKTLLHTFATGSTVPGELASSIHNEHVSSTYVEESFVTFPSLSIQELKDLQRQDSIIGKFIELWNRKVKPSKLEQKRFERPLLTLLRQWDRIDVDNGIFYRIVNDPLQGQLKQLVLPAVLKDKVLLSCHDKLGHQGIERTFSNIRSRCYWPGMFNYIKDYCKKCERCVVSKLPQPAIRPAMGHLIANRPLQILAIDFTVLEPAHGKENVLVMTDIFTKFTKAVPTKDQKAETVANVLLNEWFYVYGVPERLHSDQGRNFESDIICQLCKLYQVSRSRTTPYHPEGNAQCERFNRTLHNLLKSLPPEKKRHWPKYLPELVFSYNVTQNSTTGYSPYYLMFGRNPKLPVDFLLGFNQSDDNVDSLDDWIIEHQKRLRYAYDKAGEQTQDHADYRKAVHDKRLYNPELCVGDKVFIRNRQVKGRNKIQDSWDSTVFRVLRLTENTVSVEPDDGAGVSRTLNRQDVIKCTITQPDKTDSSSDSDSSDDIFVRRRTNRTTAGKHSNPKRLPRSVIA